MNKTLVRWSRIAELHGWKVNFNGAGHLDWRGPAGQHVVTSAGISKGRGLANSRAQLRRAGLPIP
jgi:hypothetical protein